MGVVLSKRIIEKESLKEGSVVTIQIIGKADLRDIFGIFKNDKMNVQKIREESKKEWSKW